MRDLSTCSGPWAGQWIQGDIRGTMSLRLSFEGTQISGYGADTDGTFRIAGSYDEESHFVEMIKAYPWLICRYRGEWDGQMISGYSTIEADGFFDTGHFELWPKGDDEERRLARESVEQLLPIADLLAR